MRSVTRTVLVAAAAICAAQTTSAAPAPEHVLNAPKESLNCNDSAVSKGDGSWKPSKEQMQMLGTKLSKVFPIVANQAGVPKTNYGMLYCGIHENGVAMIVANGVRKLHAKYVCDDEANFAVAFDPDKKTFGTFHFAAVLCPAGK